MQQIFFTGSWTNQTLDVPLASKATQSAPEPAVCFKDAWDSREAHFRPCFLPVISGLPAALAAVILLVQVLRILIPWRSAWMRPFVDYQTYAHDVSYLKKRRHSLQVHCLLALSILAFILQLASSVLAEKHIRAYLAVLAWLTITFELLLYRPRKIPFAILAIASLQTIAQAIILAEKPWKASAADNLRVGSIACGGLMLLMLLNMPVRDLSLLTHDVSRPFSEPASALRSPEEAITVWQFMSISWLSPLLSEGSKRQLHDEDVWSLPYEYQHRRLHDNFRELKGSVIHRLVYANAIDLTILVFVGVAEQVMVYASPVFFQLILSAMEDPTISKRVPMVYVCITLVARLIATQLGMLTLWYGRRCYERSRGEMITMLYEKTLNRKIVLEDAHSKEHKNNSNGNNNAGNGHAKSEDDPSRWHKFVAFFRSGKKAPVVKEPTSSGKLLNLMRNDVYEVAQRFWEFDSLIRKPISVVLSVTLVVNYLGWTSLVGVLLVVVAQVINAFLARLMVLVEKRRRVATDKKLDIIGQFVEAIRHLRWYGWQDSWLEKIMTARHKELMLRLTSAGVNLGISLFNTLSLDLSNVVAFAAYVLLTKKPLTVDIAFPALQLFAMMTFHLRDLPELIVTLINAWVAAGRIEDFMTEPDRADDANEALVGGDMAIVQGSFAWPSASSSVLKDISLSFPEGLTVVFGEVAAGKTALLQALLGELDLIKGSLIRPHEAIGYCAQTPWLQSMSIRDNILFSAPYDATRYKAVLDACALTPDLAEFRAGDLSLIGENGIGLSGGQRARVALARAVYSRTKILLLDDPLSALDQQTAEAIVKKCLQGALTKGRVVVLVTHRLDLVTSIANQIIKIENGRASVIDKTEAASDDSRRVATNEQDKANAQETAATSREVAAAPDKFIEEEHRAHGSVMGTVYWQYIRAGSLGLWAFALLLLVLDRSVITFEGWFIKAWAEGYGTEQAGQPSIHSTEDGSVAPSGLFDQYPSPNINVNPWILTLFGIGLSESLLLVASQANLALIVYTAGKNMFRDIMAKVAHATFRFYDVTPVGRLMNRMTSDISVIDGGIAYQLQAISHKGVAWVFCIVVIAAITPAFLVYSLFLVVAFWLIYRVFLPTSQSLRRLEMVSLTPLISNFGDLINGLTTVRAFAAQERFQSSVISVVDSFQKMDHFYWSAQTWVQWRFDILSAFSQFFLYALALATGLSPGMTAFALQQAQRFVMHTHALCKQYGQLQMEFVSVERVIELLDLEQEPEGTIRPPAWWPSFGGDIVYDNVTIKYAPHMDPALEGVTFTVKGGSKTAVLGRTGSGKSTLALSMLATIVPSVGNILVDNVDLAQVDKQLLRTRITFLAQDPVLFPGSMRQNLDPVNEHSDEDCELVLRRVCERQGWSLDTHVEGGGKNLSQGQRQLVGLARAVLRRSAIIILDEATASIDRETAMQIQEVMHEEMKDSTVITIAHRLEAVKNADYCIVLGKGKIIEQGPAAEMLQRHEQELKANVDEEAEV